MRDFKKKYGPWALVAGASEGVGAELGHKLAARGLNLVLVARNTAGLDAVSKQIRAKHNVEVRSGPIDLTHPDVVKNLAPLTRDIEIGLLAYIAGSVPPGQFFKQPLDEIMHTIRLNSMGPLYLCHHYGALMRERRRGGLILGGSGAALAGGYNFAAYSASKAFQQMLGESLWYELRPFGVDVLNLMIHGTRTPKAELYNIALDQVKGRRTMEPEEVAQEAIENIANGPTWFCGEQNREFAKLLCTPDRRAATERLSDKLFQATPGVG